jgi:hypothetical protein
MDFVRLAWIELNLVYILVLRVSSDVVILFIR